MWNSNGSTNTTYSYGATSTSFNRLYSAGSTSYTYDNNGNIKTETTGSVTKYYSYDFENRLTKVTQGSSTLGSYGYSPNGVRVLSIESGSSTVSLNMGVNVIYEKTIGQSSSNDYVFADGLLIVKLSGGTVYYYHQDNLGNTRLVTVGSQIQYSSSYQPYGPAYHPSGTDPVYKYTRKPQSPATGLYYYGARWYNTTLGRFLTRDPFRGRATEPQTMNPYSYVSNRPMTMVDPTGMLSTSLNYNRMVSCPTDFWGNLACKITHSPMPVVGGVMGGITLGVDAAPYVAEGITYVGVGLGGLLAADELGSLGGGSATTGIGVRSTGSSSRGGDAVLRNDHAGIVNPGPNVGSSVQGSSLERLPDYEIANVGGGPKYGEPARTPDEGRGWGQEKLPKEEPGGASTPWAILCGLSTAMGVGLGFEINAVTSNSGYAYPVEGGVGGLVLCTAAYAKWGR